MGIDTKDIVCFGCSSNFRRVTFGSSSTAYRGSIEEVFRIKFKAKIILWFIYTNGRGGSILDLWYLSYFVPKSFIVEVCYENYSYV